MAEAEVSTTGKVTFDGDLEILWQARFNTNTTLSC